LFGSIVPSKTPYIGALVASAIVATLTLLKVLGVWGEEFLQVLSRIPFFDIDLGWFVPSIIGFVIGLIIDRSKK
jgi:LIVCS family branched-chain amino acid:cation transporter